MEVVEKATFIEERKAQMKRTELIIETIMIIYFV